MSLTMLIVMSSRTSKREDQLRLGNPKLARMLKRSDNTRSRHIHRVEGVHYQRICFKSTKQEPTHLVDYSSLTG
jgi:hypothetical protein